MFSNNKIANFEHLTYKTLPFASCLPVKETLQRQTSPSAFIHSNFTSKVSVFDIGILRESMGFRDFSDIG